MDMERTKMDTMRIALQANGLSTSGNYDQMLQRLIAAGKKGKPGPKPKACPVLRPVPESEPVIVGTGSGKAKKKPRRHYEAMSDDDGGDDVDDGEAMTMTRMPIARRMTMKS